MFLSFTNSHWNFRPLSYSLLSFLNFPILQLYTTTAISKANSLEMEGFCFFCIASKDEWSLSVIPEEYKELTAIPSLGISD